MDSRPKWVFEWKYVALNRVKVGLTNEIPAKLYKSNGVIAPNAHPYGAPAGSLLKPQHTTRVLINWAKTHHHASESLLLTTCRAKLTFALVLHRHSRHWWLNFHDQSLMNTDGFFQETKEFEFPAKKYKKYFDLSIFLDQCSLRTSGFVIGNTYS